MEQVICSKVERLLQIIERELLFRKREYLMSLEDFIQPLIELHKEIDTIIINMKLSIWDASKIQVLIRVKHVIEKLLDFLLLAEVKSEDKYVFQELFSHRNGQFKLRSIIEFENACKLKLPNLKGIS